ncbi:glycosyltransferase family 2 protein [Thelephora terrestris]|uniref:Glycosyltransferase family 2 protein n=1 Tax=Thelephora terrestris TaxID=56493 RepID=A0A9P6HA30_9AGAM|nr:glycosyltransferase family 2 protein [Thelephora terrestris]
MSPEDLGKILVTGGHGFIGGHVAARLVGEGHRVRVVDNSPSTFHSPEGICSEFIQGNLCDIDVCRRAVVGVKTVLHFAANMGGMGTIHERNESQIYRENHSMTMNLLDASVEAGVKRFFFASSACVYPGDLQSDEHKDVSLRETDVYPSNPQGLYGCEKLNTEHLLRSSNGGMLIQIARFHNVYGPRGAWNNGREKAPAAMLRKAFVAAALHRDHGIERPCFEIWGSGKQRRSFLYIDDAVDGVISLLQSKYPEPVNIGSDRSITIQGLADIAVRCADSPPAEFQCTSPGLHPLEVDTIGVASRNSNNELVGAKLGWKPKYSLEDGLKATGNWINKELHDLTGRLLREQQLSALHELQTSRVVDLTNDSICFAILLPVTSRGSHSQKTCLDNLLAFSRSLMATTYRDTHEVGVVSFRFKIYLSIDHDDHFLLSPESKAEVTLRTAGIVDIVTIEANHAKGHVCAHWRDCARRAFEDQCDYFTLLGDDVTLKDPGWMRRIHEEFKRLQNGKGVPFGFGCVAFTDTTFPGMPTFPVIHRTHMEIFEGLVVPEVFFNQDGDPFLFQLYRRWGCSSMIEARIGNGVGGSSGARYDKRSASDWTFDTLDKAVAKVEDWLSLKAPSTVKLLTLDVVIPSYRVDLRFLDPILQLRPPETCSVMFIIIIDDPNSPSIDDLQKKYGEDPFVRIRVNKTNLGASASRNRGMKESAADWIHFLDDDIAPGDDLLVRAAEVIRERPGAAGFVGTSKFPVADSVFTTAIHLADVTYFWDIARKRPGDRDLPWGVTANLIARRNADGVDFDLIFPKTGGGEDIDFCRKKRDWVVSKKGGGGGGFCAAPAVVVTHPWWNGGRPSFWRFYGWGKGDGALVKLYPQFRYCDFAPSSGETLLLCLLGFLFSLLTPLDFAHRGEYVSLSLCGAVAVILANAFHSIYKTTFPDYDRWEFQQCTTTGSRYAIAVVVSAFIRVVSELGRTVGMLERGEIWYLGRRFDWFAGGGGRDPIANERRGSLQRLALCIVFTMLLRGLQLSVGRAFSFSLEI